LWMTTSHGLFLIDAPGATARRIAGVAAPAWSLLRDGDALLIGTSDGIYRVTEGRTPERLAGTQDLAVYEFLRSSRDPSLIWLATRTSLGTLTTDGNTYRYASIPNTPRYVRSIIEDDDGSIWYGTIFDGVHHRTVDGRVTRYGNGEMQVYRIGGRVVAVQGLSEIKTIAGGKLVPDPLLRIGDATNYFALAEDAAGNVWINSDPPRVLMKTKDGYERETRPLTGIGSNISFIRLEQDGSLWFAGSEGFFRYARTPSDQRVIQPAPLLRRVSVGDANDANNISLTGNATSLRHAFGRLRIEFAPLSYRPGVAYQYRLDPLDQRWSEWSSNSFIDYTHLDEGDYTFRVRARGAAGAESEETQWSFSVRPPWYRTTTAMLLFVVAAAALIAAIVKLRTTALRRQAARLRAQVDERTRELGRTVDLLEQANAHLERLSLLDELTGIPNRRYFDRALAQAWDEAVRTQQPVSLILLDLDHFKSLNDQRGHPAGDASLVQVARLLARKIRRSGDMVTRGGDVVARIGGEEFAILLTDTDTDGAARIAETLRGAVEELAIAFESAMLRVTVSCGVASLAPAASQTPELLVRRADRALYAAKAAGRNCVRSEAAA
jgi:diguanylate cyclase (GGDEF)-like protein